MPRTTDVCCGHPMMREPGSPPADSTETHERIGRTRSVSTLLRRLWFGLSTYRLYPEAPDRHGLAEAAARIGEAARDALAGGPVEVEIRGDHFEFAGSALPEDPNVRRLALVCFERRVERLTVVDMPGVPELVRLFRVLNTPAAELQGAGGAERVLSEDAVTSVRLSSIGPGGIEGADHPAGGTAEDGMIGPTYAPVDVQTLASTLMIEDLRGTPSSQAEVLLERMREVFAERALAGEPLIDLHTAAHEMVTDLPDPVRRSFVGILVDRVAEDPLAGRLIGTMNSAQLARALVDAGSEGRREPVELARSLAAAGVREVDVVDLTRALEAGHEDVGTIIAGLEQLGIDVDEGRARKGGSVIELLAGYLTSTEDEDRRSIRTAADDAGSVVFTAQIRSFADYLSLEPDLERAGEALGIWSEEIRRAIQAGDEEEVASNLEPIREALLGGGEERAALYAACIRGALAPDVVIEWVTAEAADGSPHLAAALAPFGDEGIDALLDVLAEEEDRAHRALLLATLRRIVQGHSRPVVSRLSDARWFVVRNAVLLLASTGDTSVLPALERVARHPSPQVRREVPEAMSSIGGAQAVPFLVELGLGADPELGHRAVVALGALKGPRAAQGLAQIAREGSNRGRRIEALDVLTERNEDRWILDELIARGSAGRLPWRLRRHVKRRLARTGSS